MEHCGTEAKKEPLQLSICRQSVTKVTNSNPQAGFKPAPSHQVGGAGGGSLPAPVFALESKYPGAGITPALPVAVWLALGPKGYAQALVSLAGPGQAKFSCPELPVQAHPPFSNLGFPIGNPIFNQVLQPQKCLSSQSKKGNQSENDPMTPAANPARTNDQSSKDRPPASQTAVPEDPKNNDETANLPAEFEMPNLATQIAPEECPEALACEHQNSLSGVEHQVPAGDPEAYLIITTPDALCKVTPPP
ncbi:hypothetical protein DSO57_1009240 [Entomophthora muscae]|uniref:Uncharacterized protein n=1 Tax=Entomophthora muscae TaxID=34485 RepID=A0ACC2TIT9_9FUNG|nr:hypothetical protein DSO57_1009240 [Entomophthora muscae]